MTAYDTAVLADSPLDYIKLDETSGTSAANAGSSGTVWTYTTNADLDQAPVCADGGTSISNNNGTSNNALGLAPAYTGLTGFSVEAWVDMGTSDQFGVITLIGLRDSTAAIAVVEIVMSAADESGAGRSIVIAGGAGGDIVCAAGPYAAAGPHHIVVTLDGSGNYTAYIDGVVVGTLADSKVGPYAMSVSDTQAFFGYPGVGLMPTADCRLDNVAFYPSVLDSARVIAHYVAGGGLPVLLQSNGVTTVEINNEPAVVLESDGVTFVWARAQVTPQGYQQRTYPVVVVEMDTPTVNEGRPMSSPYWAQLGATATAKMGPKDIHVIAPPPTDTPSLPYPIETPLPNALKPDGRWCVADLPNPSGYSDGYYWLGTPSSYDGTSNIDSRARQWAPHSSTPQAPSWQSVYPFKPSVAAVNHYLQGGGVVNHPKGVNFNSHFIEHMWATFGGFKEPYTFVVAGLVASWPSTKYVHTLLDYGRSASFNGIHYSAADCSNPRDLNEGLPYRTLLQATHTQLRAAGAGGGAVLRSSWASRKVPAMFFGVYDGGSSTVGSWRRGYKATRRGSAGTSAENHRYVILGRRNGILSQDNASHLLIFEIRFFRSALTQDQLDDQYAQLATSYKFSSYDG